MRQSLLQFLRCPSCGGNQELALDVIEERHGRIMEGWIRCSDCGVAYPVTKGVPRLLPELAKRSGADAGQRESARFRSTRRSYTNWWLRVSGTWEYEEDVEKRLWARTGLTAVDIGGSAVLDAGCGNGSITRFLAEAGAKPAIGMDLSDGVELAYEHTYDLENCHIVQGNLFNWPFRSPLFDRIVSLGVLHHTPDPHGAFRVLANQVREGGTLSVYVYWKGTPESRSSLRSSLGTLRSLILSHYLRSAIVRLPHGLILGWSHLMTAKGLVLHRVGESLSTPLASAIDKLLPHDVTNAREAYRHGVIRNYDYYSTRYNFTYTIEEVVEWFRGEGFQDLLVTPYPVSVTGTSADGGRQAPPLVRFSAPQSDWREASVPGRGEAE
jgi:uncharacterized protein YbaR (Trm112 family)/cyclopropane fatty-acyl-phospholipid synthase-like methyltransferase